VSVMPNTPFKPLRMRGWVAVQGHVLPHSSPPDCRGAGGMRASAAEGGALRWQLTSGHLPPSRALSPAYRFAGAAP
jgi:hypothetical protein